MRRTGRNRRRLSERETRGSMATVGPVSCRGARDFVVCAVGGPRVHLRRPGYDRALCGLELRGPQPTDNAPITCFSCMKRIRDTERPPPAVCKSTAAVAVARSTRVHLALKSSPPFFCSTTTLCGRDVELLDSRRGPKDANCPQCVALAKESA